MEVDQTPSSLVVLMVAAVGTWECLAAVATAVAVVVAVDVDDG